MILSLQSQRLFALAIPMMISNITTPLIGLVDTAVMGHMQDVSYLAGVSLGAIILTQVIWICGFLRMSATGLSAQAYGKQDKLAASQVLMKTCGLGVVIGLTLVLLQTPLFNAGLWLAEPSQDVADAASEYFRIRVWSAPAALANLALIGWLVGQQQHRQIMRIQILANLLNAGLDILLVFGLDMGVTGVAIASVCAEIMILVLAGMAVLRSGQFVLVSEALSLAGWQSLLRLNSDMLIRNLALQLCLAFVTYTGVSYGDMTASVNAIILQFFTLIALGLDGLAYAVEALVGQVEGHQQQSSISQSLSTSQSESSANLRVVVNNALWWSTLLALSYSLVFAVAGESIVAALTDIAELRSATQDYLWLIIALPMVSHWCFLFDGVYIGLTKASIMRTSMLFCALFFFLSFWLGLERFENWGLWICFLIFLALRGATLGYHFYRYEVSLSPSLMIKKD